MKFGVINGLIGIFLATLVGFVFGLIVGSVDERYGVGDGLGEEILSRFGKKVVLVLNDNNFTP